MTCEEFERNELDRNRDGSWSPAALEHLKECAGCAALAESTRAVRDELAALRDATQAQTPQRVAMRLMQEHRASRKRVFTRHAVAAGVWALAAAAALVIVMSWNSWQKTRQDEAKLANADNPAVSEGSGAAATTQEGSEQLVADNDSGTFLPLPGTVMMDADEASVVRVRMQRGALGALGLPVNEDRAGEWIQVDLLVGQDGQPEAVRMHDGGSSQGNGASSTVDGTKRN